METTDEPHEEGCPVSRGLTRGTLSVHSTPAAMSPHVEWAVDAVVTRRSQAEWRQQSIAPGLVRASMAWEGPVGAGSQIAASLSGWPQTRYEVTEQASPGVNAARWAHTPGLGIFHALTDAHGQTMVGEERIRQICDEAQGAPEGIIGLLAGVLGEAWDAELEPYRQDDGRGPVLSRLRRVV